MLVIVCPHCGPRNSSEFTYGGAVKERPPPDASPTEWRRYLYEEENAADWMHEQWLHVSGCRRFLHIDRHATSNEIRSVRDIADA